MAIKFPEILAPVATMEMCRAAVHNGADAIYVGMPEFNARGRAPSLAIDELKQIIDFSHRYDVKVFIAFNVLIFEQELRKLLPALEAVLMLCPDAFIVQDIGLARLIHAVAPEQPIHASTQMTITCAEAIEIVSEIGINRFVLAREISIQEMEKIRTKTTKELEVFVHGALCVSYSGQCLTSERAGGRSANRGQCAQSCRLPYELVVDGLTHNLGDKRYLVSPKDLCALEDVPKLAEIGIDSFKIEGRLKSAEYVASTVSSYRQALTESLLDKGQRLVELTSIYSRGFFNGWMDGVNHQRLVDGRYGNHHGLELGPVLAVERDRVIIGTSHLARKGDGIVFTDFAPESEFGGPIFEIEPLAGTRVSVGFSKDFQISRIRPGMHAFLNSSPGLQHKWKKTYSDKSAQKKIGLDISISGAIGQPLTATFSDRINTVVVKTETPLVEAKNSPLTHELAAQEFGALGGTCFTIANFSFNVTDTVFLHNKALKELRRRAINALESRRTTRLGRQILSVEQSLSWIESQIPKFETNENLGLPSVSVLIRDKGQIVGLKGLSLDTVYLDYEYGKEYGDSLSELRELGFKVGIATTRILKPGERGHLEYIRRLCPDVVLVRNLGALQYFQDKDLALVGDFSLNVSNSITAKWMFGKKLKYVCPSYDLNKEQLLELIGRCGGSRFEVTVHQYMPAFHMEHCVFAAFLSNGTSFRDCGRPCERHRVELRDPNGALHPVKADAECRNTMFNGIPQSAARLVPELKKFGVSSFRVEALYESADVLNRKIETYIRLVRGELTPNQVFNLVGVDEQYGVSEGQLLKIRAYKDRKKEQLASNV